MAKKRKPLWFTQPITGKAYRREMNAATRLQFGDKQRALEGEQRASQARTQDLGDWFGEYQRQLAGANQATTQGYSDAESRIAARAAAARGADTSMNADMMAQAQADAAQRGVAFDPSAFQQGGQATSYRQGQANSLADLAALQGSSENAYLNDKSRIGQGELTNQRLQEAARARGLESDMRNLQTDQGAFRLDYRNKLRGSERDFQNAKAQLGVDRASLGVKAGYNDAIRYQALMGNHKTVDVNNSYSGLGGGGGGDKSDIREAIALIRGSSKNKKKNWSDQQFVDALLRENKGIDAGEAKAAVRRWRRKQRKG